jgi:predicted dehydrogenase
MNAPLRAAIVGPGRIASTYDDEVVARRPPAFFQREHRHPGLYTVHPVNHAESYRSTPGYELVAVVGRSRERLDAFRDRWRVQAFTDLGQMLRDARPDVVSICTQSAAKAELTIQTAQAGTGVRAIVVEKAMATSMAEADAMIAACESAGVLLVVNHPYRFSPMVREAHAIASSGEIGPIGTLAGWSRGGVIHGGTHTFDLLRLFGGDIEAIVAWSPSFQGLHDQGANTMLRFASGAVGFVSLERDAVAGLDIRGSHGMLTLSPHVGEAWRLDITPLDPNAQRTYPMVAKRQPIGEGAVELSTTQRLLTDVRAALSRGSAVPSTGRDGAAALEAGIATLISASEGRAVALPLEGALRELVVPNR